MKSSIKHCLWSRTSIALFILTCLISPIYSMTDEQVVALLMKHQEWGSSQTEIMADLIERGISLDQLQRIRTAQKKEAIATQGRNSNKNTKTENNTRLREKYEPQDSTKVIENKNIDESETPIFGQNLFEGKTLNFEPNMNIPTPENYVLGPGDEVYIDIWGNSELTEQQTISPDGSIILKDIGVIYLSGLQIKEAEKRVKQSIGKVYSDLLSQNPQTFMQFSLGQARSIQVNVMGEVKNPGTYTMSAFASAFHALYAAGGINKIGTLRDIQIFRQGKKIQTIDIYKYLLKGENTKDIQLHDGDVVLVGTFNSLIEIKGAVKRPMQYEMKKDETIKDAILFAGGFSSVAFTENLNIERKGDSQYQTYTVKSDQYGKFQIKDGDIISVNNIISLFTNKVNISGAVYREGSYAIDDDTKTVKNLIQIAGGLRGDAETERGLIYREEPDLSISAISFNVGNLMSGTIDDIALQKNDVVFIASKTAKEEDLYLSIHGEVKNPGKFHFIKNLTVKDLILMSGGLLESASAARVDIYRRIKDPNANKETNEKAKLFSLSINEETPNSEIDSFVLEPYDEIFIFRSPTYKEQENVIVSGEVLFPGSYAKLQKDERISSFIKRAGGLNSSAYIEGARLIRKMSREEVLRLKKLAQIPEIKTADSLNIKNINVIDTTYIIGINLKKILEEDKNNSADLVIRAGDQIIVPTYNGTVKVQGAVSSKNSVIPYIKGKATSYYIDAAGGYDYRAARCKKYVVYMNGHIAKLRSSSQIKPGCEIVVPSKKEKREMSTGEIISISASTASLVTVLTTLIITLSK